MEQPLYELPEGWEWRSLNDISSRITDGTHHSPKTQHDKPARNRFKYITSKHVKNDGLKLENITYVDSDIHEEIYARCNPEYLDQLITKDGAMTGTCCLNTLEEPFSMLSSVALIKQKRDAVQPDFLNHYLQSPTGQEQLLGDISGAAITRTNLKKLKVVPVPIPPLNEQKHIVAKLDALFTRIDAAITHLQETLELSKALFASEANALFEQLAEEFGVVSLASVVKINSGIALPKIFKDWNSSGPIPFYKVAQMNNDARIMKDAEITFDVDVAGKNRIKIFPKGSVLIPKRGGAILTDKKRLLVEDASYDSNVMGLKADEKTISDEFLYRFMLSIHLGDYIDTAVIPQINNKHIERMEIPPAPLDSQRQIVTHLDALAEHTRTLEAETQERLDQLAALKSSLLDAAFRGQL